MKFESHVSNSTTLFEVLKFIYIFILLRKEIMKNIKVHKLVFSYYSILFYSFYGKLETHWQISQKRWMNESQRLIFVIEAIWKYCKYL